MFAFRRGSRRRPRDQSPSNRPRNHPTIDPLNFSNDIIQQADKKCFEESHLSQVLVSFANSPTISNRLTPKQATILRVPLPDTNRGANKRGTKQFFKTWFDIFNSLFYGGSLAFLRDRIELLPGIPDEENPLEHMSPLYKGEFRREVDRSPRDTGHFRFNLNMDVENNTVEAEYLGALVHEMLHAFLHCHRCECGACMAVRHPSLGGAGQAGHGTAWADAMLAIGQALQDQVPWRVEVGIAKSVDNDARMTQWQPTPDQLLRWGTPYGNYGGVRRRDRPQRQVSVDNDPLDTLRHRSEARGALERATQPPWQSQPQSPSDRPPIDPPSSPRRRSPPRNHPAEPQRMPSEPRGQSLIIEAAISASIRDAEDEQLARALALSQIGDGNRRGNESQPQPRPRSRPADPNEEATRRMIARLQADNQPQVDDEETANEELIRMMLEEDASMFE